MQNGGYLDFINLLMDARVVLTDSGGVQEETTALGVPCVTLRENTERPITVDQGTNTVVGTDPEPFGRDGKNDSEPSPFQSRARQLWRDSMADLR